MQSNSCLKALVPMAKLNLSTGNFINVEKRNPMQESTQSKHSTNDGICFLHFLLQEAADVSVLKLKLKL